MSLFSNAQAVIAGGVNSPVRAFAGVGGAPVVGDAAQWTDRIAKGVDVLKQHAIEGFTGVGFMPAKGGRVDLSDEEVAGAVDYMVGESS